MNYLLLAARKHFLNNLFGLDTKNINLPNLKIYIHLKNFFNFPDVQQI